MEEALFEHHANHFNQAEGTPYTKPDMTNAFGVNGDSNLAEEFRNGTLDLDKILPQDTYEREYMKRLFPTQDYPPTIDTEIRMSDVKKGFSIWKERTSTSPMGRVLSLYKMWLQVDDETAAKDGCMSGDTFFTMITDLIKVSQNVKLPLNRWKTVHNLFILKEPNNYNIKRLRALHKIDA